jgi:hypothetical protein
MHEFAWMTINEPNQALNGGKSVFFATDQKFTHASKHQAMCKVYGQKFWGVKIWHCKCI